MKDFQEAKKLYLDAINHEKCGLFDDAIQCYKTAFSIEPEIDVKMNEMLKANSMFAKLKEGTSTSLSVVNSGNNKKNGRFLINIFQRNISSRGKFCEPNKPTRATHISDLPPEMISHIFNWVVSSELDLRSLDKCSQVSQGFYLCARNMMLWKAACERIWGVINEISPYVDYRDMYVNRLRVETEGCYIGEVKYYREGESSFVDKSVTINKLFHLVKYYRYMRFFVDGTVFIMNSTDVPIKSVYKLRNKKPSSSDVNIGRYQVCGNRVHVNFYLKGKRLPTNYIMHFRLKKCTSHNVKCTKLVWESFKICFNDPSRSSCDIEVYPENDKFPPLIFSRVKSYLSETETSLM